MECRRPGEIDPVTCDACELHTSCMQSIRTMYWRRDHKALRSCAQDPVWEKQIRAARGNKAKIRAIKKFQGVLQDLADKVEFEVKAIREAEKKFKELKLAPGIKK